MPSPEAQADAAAIDELAAEHEARAYALECCNTRDDRIRATAIRATAIRAQLASLDRLRALAAEGERAKRDAVQLYQAIRDAFDDGDGDGELDARVRGYERELGASRAKTPGPGQPGGEER